MVKKRIKYLIFLLGLFTLGSFFYILNADEKSKIINSIIPYETREVIKDNLLPFKTISAQKKTIEGLRYTNSNQRKKIIKLKSFLIDIELEKKRDGTNIFTTLSSEKLMNNMTLQKYKLTSGFYSNINPRYNLNPGSGYIDFHDENLVVVSARGVLAFSENINDKKFIQIKNNIEKYIGAKDFKKAVKISIKDLFIFKNKIYISFIEEIKQDCFNTSIIHGDFNYKYVNFEKLFSDKECVNSKNNKDGEFELLQSGGKITSLDDNYILLSIGDYRSRFLAQDKKSVFGKIIKINSINGEHEIFSMGHRNPQGLYFDKENKFVLETEHGPRGGDEINLIETERIDEKIIPNYGWPVVSAGEHYGGKTLANAIRYRKYPLHKSHSKYGFIEPLKSFVPSVGISDIVKYADNSYVASSLKGNTLFFFNLNENKKINIFKKVLVNERIRDLAFRNDNLFLFMEDTASIGQIKIK